MKKLAMITLGVMVSMLTFVIEGFAQPPVNWTNSQLMEPSALAAVLTSKKALPIIICVGPGAMIPNSIDIGMVNTRKGLAKLKDSLNKLPKNSKIVIYCGCCPFEHCPDVRPAIDVLKQLNFTNYYLLDLPVNIRKDWVDKGYPVTK